MCCGKKILKNGYFICQICGFRATLLKHILSCCYQHQLGMINVRKLRFIVQRRSLLFHDYNQTRHTGKYDFAVLPFIFLSHSGRCLIVDRLIGNTGRGQEQGMLGRGAWSRFVCEQMPSSVLVQNQERCCTISLSCSASSYFFQVGLAFIWEFDSSSGERGGWRVIKVFTSIRPGTSQSHDMQLTLMGHK